MKNFFFGTHDVYHKECLLFAKAMHFIFKHKKTESDMQCLVKI